MRVVSYTRFISCLFADENPVDIIKQQNQRIKKYADEHGWTIKEKYSDRKQDRDADNAFNQLIQDGMARNYDLVVVDSLVRTGKNLWFAREILMQTFFPAGLHFAVVEDDFCSIDKTNDEVEKYFADKVSWYHQETIRRRVNERNRKGILSWNDLKYGYQMTEDYQMIPNPETAPVVKRMYKMFLDGILPVDIAETFKKEKIPTPLVMRKTKTKVKDPYAWTDNSIKRMLKCEAYTGHWMKKYQNNYFDFYHESLISEEDYQKTLKILEERSIPTNRQGGKNKYAGYICEEDGVNALRYYESKYGDKYFRSLKSVPYSPEHISLEDIDLAVSLAFRNEKAKAIYINMMLEQYGEEELQERLVIENTLMIDAAYKMAELEKERMTKYIDGQNGDERFDEISKEINELESKIKHLRGRMHTIKKAYSQENPWLKLYLGMDLKSVETINRQNVRKYLGRIIMDVITIKRIEMLHQNWLAYFPAEWRNSDGSKK